MAHIKAPNPITGTHASLNFVNGEADTENEWLIHWFKTHGYDVKDDVAEKKANRTPKLRKADPNVENKS